jgi:EAL domain-containing protein (putative c-di-GMP-specific phosphodiesterase class I)
MGTCSWAASLGCDIGQGFSISPPLAEVDLLAWLRATPAWRPVDP